MKYQIRALALAAGLWTTGTAAGLAAWQPPAGYPADYGTLLKAAEAEKSLLIYTNMEATQWEGAIQLLKERVPGIDVRLLELNSGEIGARYAAETAAGMPTADLLVTTDVATWVELMQKDRIEPYVSSEADIYPAWSKPAPGLYTIAADPMMFMWNKALLPENLVPSSFADLAAKVAANPAVFKNKLTSYNPTTPYGYNAAYAFVDRHGEKGWEWLKVVAPMTRPDGTGPMIEKVTAGEYVLAYFMGAGAARLALKNPQRAALLGLKPIADGSPLVLRGAGIPKNAARKNAAKAMLDVLLSKPGQISLGLRARTPVRPDVTSADVDGELTYADVVKTLGEANVIPVAFDPKMASNTAFDAFQAAYKKAAGK
ncbi:ABC transporter substrate-binding protein [Ancylobacter terrae]|uniref:ABC transporter substrate-binding protein n=1 Tax=Ancylobacter sp. sgz301288 TaxID=3342077 RepID=UPI00385B2FDC